MNATQKVAVLEGLLDRVRRRSRAGGVPVAGDEPPAAAPRVADQRGTPARGMPALGAGVEGRAARFDDGDRVTAEYDLSEALPRHRPFGTPAVVAPERPAAAPEPETASPVFDSSPAIEIDEADGSASFESITAEAVQPQAEPPTDPLLVVEPPTDPLLQLEPEEAEPPVEVEAYEEPTAEVFEEEPTAEDEDAAAITPRPAAAVAAPFEEEVSSGPPTETFRRREGRVIGRTTTAVSAGVHPIPADEPSAPTIIDTDEIEVIEDEVTQDVYLDEPAAVAASEPVASEPVASEPVASEPVSSEPVSSEPVSSEPVSSEPVASEPVTSEPAARVAELERPAAPAAAPAIAEAAAARAAVLQPLSVGREVVSGEGVGEMIGEVQRLDPDATWGAVIDATLSLGL